MPFSADPVDFYFLQFLVRQLWSESPKHFWEGPPGRHSPRGLMVLSSVSLSLLDFPLDIRAAMENALARDESCGFGDDVYSMSGGEGGPSRGNRPKYSTDEPREILQKLLTVVHQQRETSRSVLRAVSNETLWKSARTHVGPEGLQRLQRVLRFVVGGSAALWGAPALLL